MGLVLLTTYLSGFDSFASDAIRVHSLSCAVMGVIGGYAALNRKWFPIAVLGATAAIFTPAFFFAIPGLILIANSATRFKGFENKP